MEINTSDIIKLRQVTGAGMMDCKKALTEANGNFDDAIKIIREKGKAIANKRADRVATEGAVLAKTSKDNKFAAILVLNCETDFVAKNDNFVGFAISVLDLAIEKAPANLDALKELVIDGKKISDKILDMTAAVGEKIELSYYETVKAENVAAYIHPGNRVASIIGFNKVVDANVGKDLTMQIAAMNPVAIDKSAVPQSVIDRELEIGREQARLDGKAEDMLDKIAQGKLGKFFKESTLVEQAFIRDGKKTVGQYLQEVSKDLAVTGFLRYSIQD